MLLNNHTTFCEVVVLRRQKSKIKVSLLSSSISWWPYSYSLDSWYIMWELIIGFRHAIELHCIQCKVQQHPVIQEYLYLNANKTLFTKNWPSEYENISHSLSLLAFRKNILNLHFRDRWLDSISWSWNKLCNLFHSRLFLNTYKHSFVYFQLEYSTFHNFIHYHEFKLNENLRIIFTFDIVILPCYATSSSSEQLKT